MQMKESSSGLGDKSFVSNSGMHLGSQGVVSGFNLGGGALENSLIKNMLSTPSSKKSDGDRSYKTSSPDEERRKE
jgi:hypothetical protein